MEEEMPFSRDELQSLSDILVRAELARMQNSQPQTQTQTQTYYPSQGHEYSTSYVNHTFGADPQAQQWYDGAVQRVIAVDRAMDDAEMRAAARYMRDTYDGPTNPAPRASRARGPEIFTDIEPEDL